VKSRIRKGLAFLGLVGLISVGAMFWHPLPVAAGGTKPLLVSGNPGDTVADAVLGQVNVPRKISASIPPTSLMEPG
jgi:hypothetical protein